MIAILIGIVLSVHIRISNFKIRGLVWESFRLPSGFNPKTPGFGTLNPKPWGTLSSGAASLREFRSDLGPTAAAGP